MHVDSLMRDIDPELLKGISVLYVEGEKDVREQLSAFLKRRVGNLYAAGNGQEGLEAFKAHRPDIVITDIKMPVMDGIRMTKAIKNIDRETPVIITTAYTDKDLVVEAINIGIDKYLIKPIDPYRLIDAVYKSAVILFHYKGLKRQATTDALTGLYNRVQFNESLSVETKRTVRYKTPLSLIMFDIDRFKPINDTYGHQAGDCVLQELTDLVARNIREQDVAARWGGEEFMLLIPDNDAQNAKQLAEKLRTEIEKSCFYGVCSVTCSFGVTQFRNDDSVESFTKRVDSAMYKAKDNGRNRVEVE